MSKLVKACGNSAWSKANEQFEVGQELTVERFEAGQIVDVIGQSKGKGFQGGVKRWNFQTARCNAR